ncbi:hypothetical protein [Calycomorphotria hydatis]|uniref:Uncharacterized protein n=1 Tax=Calycomorphotria hydatis TaxID=2528027 RepID=A0A517T3E3_9PLAN|nr:hypothetical protein [Calycomorphotria hydatis]QDT62886.1 hypothetical protein V22_00840 [Calycomorphotria hydatis]
MEKKIRNDAKRAKKEERKASGGEEVAQEVYVDEDGNVVIKTL